MQSVSKVPRYLPFNCLQTIRLETAELRTFWPSGIAKHFKKYFKNSKMWLAARYTKTCGKKLHITNTR